MILKAKIQHHINKLNLMDVLILQRNSNNNFTSLTDLPAMQLKSMASFLLLVRVRELRSYTTDRRKKAEDPG